MRLASGSYTVGVSRYPAYNWVVTSWLPDADTAAVTGRVTEGGAALVRHTALLGLGIAVLMAAVIALLARTLVRRIGRLTDVLRRVAARDLSATTLARANATATTRSAPWAVPSTRPPTPSATPWRP